jgi:SAM-dependent methyltransferase
MASRKESKGKRRPDREPEGTAVTRRRRGATSQISRFARRSPVLIRRAVGAALFDRLHGVETWRPVDLATLGLGSAHRVEYTPSGWLDVRRALARERIDADDVFVDLGSGKGRVVLQAAQFGFRRVIGVELSAELTAVAAANVEAARSRLRCQNVELVTEDVVDYQIPDDVTYAYIYNAFTGPVFQWVADELIASVDRRPRTLRLLYRTPREHERLTRTGRFQLVREVTAWRPTREWASRTAIHVYEVKPACASPDRATARR